MKGIVKLILVGAVAYGAYYFYDTTYGDGAIEGTWRSDKEASLKEAEDAGYNARRLRALGTILGKMTYEIEDGAWTASFDGDTYTGTYSTASGKDQCYNFASPDFEGEESEVCIRDGKLYMYSEMGGFHEVYEKL